MGGEFFIGEAGTFSLHSLHCLTLHILNKLKEPSQTTTAPFNIHLRLFRNIGQGPESTALWSPTVHDRLCIYFNYFPLGVEGRGGHLQNYSCLVCTVCSVYCKCMIAGLCVCTVAFILKIVGKLGGLKGRMQFISSNDAVI